MFVYNRTVVKLFVFFMGKRFSFRQYLKFFEI